MAREVDGEIIVGIDKPASKLVMESDLKEILSQIRELEAKISHATLEQSALDELQKQLDTLKTTINIANIKIDQQQVVKTGTQSGKTIGNAVSQGINDSLLRNKNSSGFKEIFSQSATAAKDAQKYFKSLLKDENAIITTMEHFDDDKLNSFTINIKRASGEVESLNYSLKNIGKDSEQNFAFKFTGGSTNEAGAIRQIQQIEKTFSTYTQKIEQFKSTNSNILSGLSIPLNDFETKLNGLKNGSSSIDDVTKSFQFLNAETSKILANLSGQLNKVDAAVRNIETGEETIAGLKAEFNGLSNAPSDINLQLQQLSSSLKNIKKIEAQEGRTANWTKEYQEWSNSIKKVSASLAALKKAEKNSVSTQVFNVSDLKRDNILYMQKVYNTVEKQIKEIQHLSNAQGWQDFKVTGFEEANGKIKRLTLTITDAEGAIKKLNFQKEKLKGTGKAQNGLMQVGDVQIIKTAAQAYEALTKNKNLAEQDKYYKTIKTEIGNLYQLQEKLLSADKLQSAELEKQIEASKKLISYNQQELDNKGLRDNGLDEEITNLETAKQKRLEIITAKLQDATAAKAVAQAEREAAAALKEEELVAEQVRQIMSYMDGTGSKSYDLQLATQIKNYRDLGFTEDEVAQRTENLCASYEKLKNIINNTEYDSVAEKNKAIVSANEEYTISLNQVSNTYKTLKKDTEQYYNETKQINLTNKIQRWLSTNTNVSDDAKRSIQEYYNELSSGRVSVERLTSIEKALKQIDTTQRGLGKISSFAKQWASEGIAQAKSMAVSALSFTQILSTAKQGITSIKELDTSLVDLRKTTSMNNTELEDFYYASNDVAKQMGVSTKEIIDQASSWSRLGYSTSEAATQMAKISSQFKLISPGMSSDEATSGLVSIMKAYDIDVDNVLDGIMSKVNTIGNKFALSNADIVAMLQDSVSAMKEANNSLEETIALETAAYEIVQDRSVGNGFKTVALRLRGLNEETEEVDESLKTIKGDLYELTGVSIMADENTYKSTYQILKEMSEVWGDLTDKTKAEALELMFGKLRANIGASVLKNFSAAEKAMKDMANSAGSADAEMSVAMDSIEYKINSLKETGTGIAQNIFNRDDIKSVIDILGSFANAIDSITDKLGFFGTIGAGIGTFTILKNLGRGKRYPLISNMPIIISFPV